MRQMNAIWSPRYTAENTFYIHNYSTSQHNNVKSANFCFFPHRGLNSCYWDIEVSTKSSRQKYFIRGGLRIKGELIPFLIANLDLYLMFFSIDCHFKHIIVQNYFCQAPLGSISIFFWNNVSPFKNPGSTIKKC